MARLLKTVFLLGVLALLAAAGAGFWWVHQPLRLPAATQPEGPQE